MQNAENHNRHEFFGPLTSYRLGDYMQSSKHDFQQVEHCDIKNVQYSREDVFLVYEKMKY